MTEHGQRHVDAAKADGRWDSAYAPASQTTIPEDLAAAIKAVPQALATFEQLTKQNVYALAYRTRSVKTAAARATKIERFVAMLARGETIYPQKATNRSEPPPNYRARRPIGTMNRGATPEIAVSGLWASMGRDGTSCGENPR